MKSVEHVPGKSIFGTDYSSVDVTVITFDTFIVTSGMKTIMPEDNLGEEMSVYITGFEGMYGAGVTDMRGNGILEYDTSIKPAQQEFIDAMKPNLTTSLTYNSTKKKYWASVSGEWMFTVPFTVEEPADVANGVYSSGLDGKQGTFSFFMNDEKSHPFQWYIDDNPGCQSDSTRWKNARTAYGTYSEEYNNQFAETEGTSYLHIKVIEDEAYPYEDISYICGDITFKLTDWAGNSSTTKIPICYNADTVAPAIEVISYRVTLDDIATNTATMHIKLRLSDSFGLGSTGSYSYQSNDNNPSESVRQDFDIVEGSREQIIDFDLPFTMGSTDYYKDYTRFVYFLE